MRPTITDQQRRFAEEYIVDRNATRAAIRAGYSEDTAYSQGQRLLKNVEIRRVVDDGLERLGFDTKVTAEKVVRELARVAFSDMRAVADWDEDGVRFKSSQDLDDDEAASVKEVTHKVTHTRNGSNRELSVKQHDKVRALEMLGKHFGIFNDADGNDQAAQLLQLMAQMMQQGITVADLARHLGQRPSA